MPMTEEDVAAMRASVQEAVGALSPDERIGAIQAISNCAVYLAAAATLIERRGWGQGAWSRGVLGRVMEASDVTARQRRFSVLGATVAAIYAGRESDPDGAMRLCCDIMVHSLLQGTIGAEGTPEQRWARAQELCQQPGGSMSVMARWNEKGCAGKHEARDLLRAATERATLWAGHIRQGAS